ncbi:EamA family transporter [Candidatus Woesearchaeota archaeon]|nr:EamA family transporter [Candidatus Woesearchaeota archaeon]
MKTKPFAIVLVAICTIFTALGQLFFKLGSAHFSLSDPLLFRNLPLLIGFLLYGAGAGLLIISLKYGELSVLYPIVSLSYIWVSLLSLFFLQEPMNLVKWLGIGAIVVGVSFIAKSTPAHKVSESESLKRSVVP